MRFEDAVVIILRVEGGYSQDPRDPGGETNFGITAKTARSAGYIGAMRNIPMSMVKAIYKSRYWNAVRADDLPDRLRLSVFDMAVHSGPREAISNLQNVVGAKVDGKMGPETIQRASGMDVTDAVLKFNAGRLRFLTHLMDGWRAFGFGWARRIATIMENT